MTPLTLWKFLYKTLLFASILWKCKFLIAIGCGAFLLLPNLITSAAAYPCSLSGIAWTECEKFRWFVLAIIPGGLDPRDLKNLLLTWSVLGEKQWARVGRRFLSKHPLPAG